jgi:hypothetical protein
LLPLLLRAQLLVPAWVAHAALSPNMIRKAFVMSVNAGNLIFNRLVRFNANISQTLVAPLL